MGKNPPKWLPGERVDETILTQRKSVEELKADRMIKRNSDASAAARERVRRKLAIKKARKLATKRFVPAQAILHTAEKRIKNARAYAKAGEVFEGRKRVRKPQQIQQTYKHARIALVIRAKGKMLPQEVKDGFEKLQLPRLYTARLVQLTPETHKMLQQLRRFTIIGYPGKDQLEALLRSRGGIWMPNKNKNRTGGSEMIRTQLTGNLIVERAFAEKYNVYTIEELADAVFGKTRSVSALLGRIAHFDLHPPRHLFFERNRSVHDKLEVLNAESFAAMLASTLDKTPKAAAPKLGSAATAAGRRRGRGE